MSEQKEKDSPKIYICTLETCEDMNTEPKNLCCLVCPLHETCRYQCDMIRMGEVQKPENCEYAKMLEVQNQK